MTDSYVVRNLHASSLSGKSKEEEIQRQAVLEERAAHRRTARHCKLLVTAKHLEDEAPRSRKPFFYLFVVLCRPMDARTHLHPGAAHGSVQIDE